ncbi:ribokinase [Pacificoceanicola onchidii]|uniref:ribokinase n=1 Tax=Pacificoceanicola onchidii TaxID=2562685 RepID=UPI0010A5E2C2|nr:ribokinase [Pacificoceanicola onchidii]
MTIFNLGSINADLVYRVPHLPAPGETLAATGFTRGLGGKGANMSVAAARAGARCVHIGAVGGDGVWALDRLTEYGVDTRQIAKSDEATGHAIIAVDEAGENAIILHPGANAALKKVGLINALAEAQAGDFFLTQNETTLQAEGARMAQAKGLRVAYAAAPFEADAVQAVLPFLDLLVLNAVEAAQLEDATEKSVADLSVKDIVVTLGADGCRWYETEEKTVQDFPAFKVDPVDTTGAGDTFTGYLIAGLDRGMPMEQAIRLASKAGALMVTRLGTADVIPDLKDVQDASFN